LETARVDAFALVVTVLTTACAALLFGTFPAMVLSSAENGSALKEGARASSGSRRNACVREALVISEVALTYVLLVCAGLLIHSLARLLDVDPGFRPENTLAIRIQTYRDFEKRTAEAAYYEDLLRRVREIPGVHSATLPDKLPLDLNDMLKVHRKGEGFRRGEAPTVFAQGVDQSYFKTLGIPLRSGREFEARDPQFEWEDAKIKDVIVNQRMAASFWPGESALGKSIVLESFPNATAECRIIGVVGNVRESALEREAGPEIYMVGGGRNELVLRTRVPPSAMIPLVRTALRQVDPGMAVADFRPLGRIIDEAVAPRRLICSLLGAFSVTALALAAMGIYGVMACSVCQRSKEFGIRLALGSPRRALLRLILRQGMRLTLLGCLAGIAGSVALTRTLQSLLFGVGPTDPVPLAASTTLAVGVMLLASWLPAHRASTVDPIAALRG
jgi:predicted permease